MKAEHLDEQPSITNIDDELDDILAEHCYYPLHHKNRECVSCTKAKQAITNKIKEAELRGYDKAWKTIHEVIEVGDIKGQYKILERVRKKTGNNAKFKVECVECGDFLYRYSNKFNLPHQNCENRQIIQAEQQLTNQYKGEQDDE
jgi:Zn ribbon nucleic-acid-binding protein